MILAETSIKEQDQNTASLPILAGNSDFNWKQCWYPVTFVQDLPKDRPFGFSLYDEPLVLFRSQDGQLGCLSDRCSHRAAKLSDGQLIDGKIECLYHGWQFDTEGKCLHIPQLPADAKIPTRACVRSLVTAERQGIIWVWPGEPEAADLERIPTISMLDKPGIIHTDFILDLPYNHTYLVENVLDPAHIHISHQGTQGNRKEAQPLEIQVIESSAQRIQAKYREANNPNKTWKQIEFVAPNLVHNVIDIGIRGWFLGLVFYALPLGKSRCRLLFRTYRNFAPWTAKLRPRWLDHLRWNKILEEDLPLIVGQEEQIERLGKSLKEIYLPLKTADTLVIEYRKWLDKFGSSLPFYEGYSTSKHALVEASAHEQLVLQDRFSRHTRICSACDRAYQITNRLQQVFIAVAVGMAALAMAIAEPSSQKLIFVLAFLAAVGLAAVAQRVKTKFERSYERH